VKLLLDTHILVWWAFLPHLLSKRAYESIEDADNEAFVSAVSAMEIATKVRLGKFEAARPLANRFADQVLQRGFLILPMTADHGEHAGNLAIAHKDPWDRLLVAQAQLERLTLVTADKELATSGVMTLW
jgi:PIN domain nuclease of toxin-antitoxin system